MVGLWLENGKIISTAAKNGFAFGHVSAPHTHTYLEKSQKKWIALLITSCLHYSKWVYIFKVQYWTGVCLKASSKMQQS